MNPTKTLYYLFLPAFLLPVFITFLVIFGRLFHGLGNLAASEVLQWTSFAAAMLWLTNLVGLLLLVALRAILSDSHLTSDISKNSATSTDGTERGITYSEEIACNTADLGNGKTTVRKKAHPSTESPDDEVVYF